VRRGRRGVPPEARAGARRGRKTTGLSPFAAGSILIAIVAIVTYLVFTNDVPFTRPFQIKIMTTNAANLKTRSPVRIAGVNVGQVKSVEPAGPDSTTSIVTVNIDKRGLPIFKDARVRIRPRIFLEGNFFVDIQPGTPGQPKIHDRGTIPVSQVTGPVQLDQVLTSLQYDTRRNLQRLIRGYGNALDGKPAPGEDDDQDPATRGETAAQSLNDSLKYSPDALRGVAIVNQAAQGTDLHDLSKLIAGSQKVAAALTASDQTLKDLVTNFNTTVGAFASEQGNLRQTIALLPGVLRQANVTFDALNRSFPPTRAFAREILPGVRQTAPTITAAFPWIRQVRALVSPAELQGLVHDLQPAVSDLSSITDKSLVLIPQIDLANRCMIKVVLPTGDKPVNDGFLSTGLPNYKEFWQAMVGLSGEGQNFDGNGSYTRFQTGGGSQTFSTGPTGVGNNFSGEKFFGNPATQPFGTRPARPATKPPYNRTFPCYRNKPPNLKAKTGPGF
jgi:phospholipid/cholesterol/gamma-HCH transport system substrate-binding protein